MNNNIKFFTFVKDKGTDAFVYREYEAPNIIAGDTDSSYADISSIAEKCRDEEQIVQIADDVADKVKERFPEFLEHAFNIPEKNRSIIDADREVVSDKSYFLGKKNYYMSLFDKEGDRNNEEPKIMGLEIRRSDTPKIVQKFLQELIETITDGKTYEDVQELVENFKEKYMNSSILEIGRPMSVKVFKKYEDEYNKTGNMKSFPYHVRASLFYNSFCDSTHRKIRSGDKIRICYINHPHSSYIAVPVDGNDFPDIVYEVSIDWQKQWSTVQKKIQNYLEPINWDDIGLKKQALSDLFGVDL